jgi:hypothetical protein
VELFFATMVFSWSDDMRKSVSHFDSSVSGIGEVVVAFVGKDGTDEMADVSAGVVDGTLLCDAHPVLDLRERLLGRIEVGRVSRRTAADL